MANPYAAKSKAKVVESEENEVDAVPSGTVSEVLAWVGEDKERAQAALDKENDGAKRTTLVRALEEILEK